MHPLVILLKEGSQGAMRGAQALGNLAYNSEHRKAQIVKTGVLLLLVKLMKEGLEGAKGLAANALGQLAFNCEERSALTVDAGALQPLIEMLKEEGSGFDRGQAAFALGNLAVNSDDRSVQIVNAGALPLLVALLKMNEPGWKHIKRAAEVALAHLSNCKALRAQIDAVGVGRLSLTGYCCLLA